MSNFVCSWPECGKQFASRTGLWQHRKRKRHDVASDTATLICPFVECDKRLQSLATLCTHVRNEHHVPEAVIQRATFETIDQFTEWKKQMEDATKSSYVQHSAAKKIRNTKWQYFYCHRSGNSYKGVLPSDKRRRALKKQGIVKMKATCTAHMSIKWNLTSGKVNCKVCTFHVGHTNDFERRRGSRSVDSVQVGLSAETSPPVDDQFNHVDSVAPHLRGIFSNSIDDMQLIDAAVLKCRQVEAMLTSGTYTKQALLDADRHLSAAEATLQVASSTRVASLTAHTPIVSQAALTLLAPPACLVVTRKLASNEKPDKPLKYRPLLPKPPPAQNVVLESTKVAALTLASMTKLNDATINVHKRNSTVLRFDEVPYCEEVVSST